jgi:O-methyltransferase
VALMLGIEPYTKTGTERFAAMAAALRRIDAEGIPGVVVECGVWRGGNIILARKLSPGRVCWLYDTFTGMTPPEPVDVSISSGKPASISYNKKMQRGDKWAGVSVEEVRANLSEMGVLDDDKLRFVVGPVEKTLTDKANLPSGIALLRLDTDWFASTKIELEVLYPIIAPGGILIVDDYGHWAGSKKAVDKYFGPSVPMHKIDYTAIQIVKPC